MEGLKLPKEIINLTLQKLESRLKEYLGSDSLQKEANQLESKRERLNTMYELGQMNDAKYRAGIEEIRTKLKELRKQGITSTNKEKIIKERIDQTEKFLRNFGKFWRKNAAPEDQREWILMTIKRIWVKNKKVVAIEPHDEFRDLFKFQQKAMEQPPLATPVGVFLLDYPQNV